MHSLRNKVILSFFLVSILVVGASVFSTITSRKAVRSALGESQAQLAREIQNRIEVGILEKVLFVEAGFLREDLLEEIVESNTRVEARGSDHQAYVNQIEQQWGQHHVAGDNSQIVRTLLENSISRHLKTRFIDFERLSKGYQSFNFIFVTNNYGDVVGATGVPLRYNYADADWWELVNQSREIYIGEVEVNANTGQPGMVVAIPLLQDRTMIGVAWFQLSIDGLFAEVVQAANENLFGEIVMINDRGETLYSTTVHDPFEDISYTEMYKRIIEGKRIFNILEFGQKKLVTVDEGDEYLSLPPVNIFTIVKTDVSASSPLFKQALLTQRLQVLLYTIIVLIGVIFIVIFMYNIIQPLRRMRDLSNQYSQGSLDLEVPLGLQERRDEIGELARAFESMRNQIARVLKNLDAEVKNKTKDLEHTKKELESRISELEESNETMVHRELRMIELKKEIDKLKAQIKN